MRIPGYRELASSLALAMLSMGVVAAENAAGDVSPAGQTLATQMHQSLTAQGWAGTRRADGSVDYRRSAAADQPAPAPAPAKGPQQHSLAAQLREQLDLRGWTATLAEDGGVYYRLPSVEESPASGLADDIQRQLSAQGWVGSTAADGSVIYRRLAPPLPATAAPLPGKPPLAEKLRRQLAAQGWVSTPAADGGVYYRQPEATVDAPPTLTDDLRGQLVERGWVGSVTADGSVIYRYWRSVDRSHAASGGETPAHQLQQQLQGMGWSVAPADDGGLLYLPPADMPPAQPRPSQPIEQPAEPPAPEHSSTSGGADSVVVGDELPVGPGAASAALSDQVMDSRAGSSALPPQADNPPATDSTATAPGDHRPPVVVTPHYQRRPVPYAMPYRSQQWAYGQRWSSPPVSSYGYGYNRQPMLRQPPMVRLPSPSGVPPNMVYPYR